MNPYRGDYDDAALAAADSWTAAHSDFIGEVFAEFVERHAWPSPNHLQRKLHRLKRRIQVFDLAQEMPPQLGFPWRGPDGEVSVRIRALKTCDAATPYLAASIRLLRLAYQRYTDEDEERPALQADDLRSDDDRLAALLLTFEPFHVVTSSGDPFGTGWSGPINLALAHEIEHVATVDDYLSVEAAFFRAQGIARPSYGPQSVDQENDVAVAERATPSTASSRDVFIVHGRDVEALDAMTAFTASLGLHAIDFDELIDGSGETTPYIGDMLEVALARATAIIVLLTGDDIASLRAEFHRPSDPPSDTTPTPQARPNVIFEAGMAMALHRRRTILVEIGIIRPFTDTSGRYTVRMDGSLKKRQDLVRRLKHAGCDVDESGDWQHAGDFKQSDEGSERSASTGPFGARQESVFDQALRAGSDHTDAAIRGMVRSAIRGLTETSDSWSESPPTLPEVIRNNSSLTAWEGLTDPMDEHFDTAVTEVVRVGAGLIAAGVDVSPLSRALRDEFIRDHPGPTLWVSAAPQLMCRVAADQLLAVAYDFESWETLHQLCAPILSDGGESVPWVLSHLYRWPAVFDGNVQLGAEFSISRAERAAAATDLDIPGGEFAKACAAVQVALDVAAAAYNSLHGRPVNGFVFGIGTPDIWSVIRRWEEQDGLLTVLAGLSGEDLAAFKSALPDRIARELTRRQGEGMLALVPTAASQARERIATSAGT